MPEMKKAKKLRLYKFASEYNLSTESIMEFLEQKGYEIKSHMTILTDEMIADIEDKFRKDIESAEKHYRKISEFHKKRTDKDEPEAKEEPKEVEAEEPQPDEANAEDEVKESEEEVETVEEKEAEVEAVQLEPETDEEEQTEEMIEEAVEDKKPVEEIVENVIEEDVQEEEDKPYQTEAERELSRRKTGLKVVGKIDLDAERKKREQERAKRDERRKEEQAKARQDKPKNGEKAEPAKDKNGKPATAAAGANDQDDSKDPKKKKKKRLKAKNKQKVEEKGDELKAAKKKRKAKKQLIDKKEVEDAIKRTMLSIDESANASRANFKKKKRKEKAEQEEKLQEQRDLEKSKLKVTEYISVSELANLMDVGVSQVIQKAMEMGMMVSINQRLDEESITLLADEFEFEVSFEEEYKADIIEEEEEIDEDLKSRPPVVTIMGHVDHGKTSLLDYIRKANVVAGESGGITQHIGAYKVLIDDGKSITFLDTPGHEAFTAMRARGAKVTDIVVLIVAADDAVMPQTVEAINHAQAAGVPIIIAINKIDKPNANPDKIRQQLADRNILVEDWGGKYQAVEISAKAGIKVDELLEKILLEAELLELRANPDRDCRGTVIESQLDKGRGVTSTILVQKGTMKVGDPFVSGNTYGRVRAMFDERGNKVDEAGPSTPVLVLGFDSAPQAGDTFVVVESEREAREVGLKRQQLKREQDHRQVRHITLDEIASQISQGGVKELPIVVKGDVDGSVEALADSLMKITNKEVHVQVIHKGVGAISEGDVLLAAASHAIIVGFHVRPHTNARKLAEQENVDIRLYNVIYDAINEVKSALEGMLSPVISEELVATIEVRETFKVPKLGTIAGCYVQDGKITRNDKIRLFREGVAIYTGELASLKRFKDDVREVDSGYECGLNISNFNDIKVGDIIEAYKIVETKKKLED